MVWNDGACIQTNWRNLHLASISWKTTSFHNSAEKKRNASSDCLLVDKTKTTRRQNKKNICAHNYKAGLCISINKNRYTRSLSLSFTLANIFVTKLYTFAFSTCFWCESDILKIQYSATCTLYMPKKIHTLIANMNWNGWATLAQRTDKNVAKIRNKFRNVKTKCYQKWNTETELNATTQA